jgi:hypothetical protein
MEDKGCRSAEDLRGKDWFGSQLRVGENIGYAEA